MSPISGRLDVQYLKDGRWLLTRELRYTHRDFGLIVVPEGTITDLDSVPRLPLAFWLVKGAAVLAPVIHDWLYQEGRIGLEDITREDADRIFLEIMEEEGVWWWRRRLIWAGVRAGGWLAWNKHRKAEEDPDFV